MGFMQLKIKATKIKLPAKKNSDKFLNNPKNKSNPQTNSIIDEIPIAGFKRNAGI